MQNHKASGVSRKVLRAVAFALLAVLTVGAAANFAYAKRMPASFGDVEVEWRQIVGILAPGLTVGTGTGKVTGGGSPWHSATGNAEVDLTTGNIRFAVEGLVLASGNSIGTPGPVSSVKGTLVCDTTGVLNGGNSTLVDTPVVPLSAQGNASFRGSLGALPTACTSQPSIAFVIRAGNAWIASGMIRVTETGDDENSR